MLNWMLWTNNDFNLSHRNQFNDPSDMELVASLLMSYVRHVVYLKVCHTIKKMKPLIILSLQLM